MRDIKLRYTYRRREDGHIWQLMASMEGFEGGGDNERQIVTMRDNDQWELIGRDLFTGLTDKNGVEIYEGDILKWGKGKNIKVLFNKGRYFAAYVDESPLDGIAPKTTGFNPIWDVHTEIIGNIYESPELLK